jgi:hypothetical protein
MHRKLLVLSIIAAFVLLGFAYDAQGPSAPEQSSVAPAGSAGMILNIDPVTGAIVDEAAPSASKLAVPASLAERWSTSDEGLVVQPNPSGGKGVYINLQGRFENGMVATVDASGKLTAPCAQGLNTAANTAASEK